MSNHKYLINIKDNFIFYNDRVTYKRFTCFYNEINNEIINKKAAKKHKSTIKILFGAPQRYYYFPYKREANDIIIKALQYANEIIEQYLMPKEEERANNLTTTLSNYKQYQKRETLEYPDSYVVIDTETNDLGTSNRIIEISGIKYINNKGIDTFSYLVNPNNKKSVNISVNSQISLMKW